MTANRYDTDPEALAWARRKIQNEIDRADKFVADAKKARNDKAELTWRVIGNHLRRSFIGGTGCVIAAFDERLPEWTKRIDGALPAPIDRAIRRDHSLCGTEPCSDCR